MENNSIIMHDLFISHSWLDKEIFIDPLVAALESAGIKCWYDLTEIKPGDSLIERINYGLTHSKIILLCLSDNFFKGDYSVVELETAISLSIISPKISRIIPLMLGEPKNIIYKCPAKLASMVHIRWSDNLNNIIAGIKKSLSIIDGVGKDYWLKQAQKAYNENNYIKSIIYSKKSLEYDQKDYSANLYYLSSLIKNNKIIDAIKFIGNIEEWEEISSTNNFDRDILDFIQKSVCEYIVEYSSDDKIEYDDSTYSFLHFYATTNNNNAWHYLVKFYDIKKFEHYQAHIVRAAAYIGKEKVIDWLENKVMLSQDEEVLESLTSIFYILISLYDSLNKRILNCISILLNNENEEIRAISLVPYYYFANNGNVKVIESLNDKAEVVRSQALELLSGEYKKIVTQNWEIKDGPDRAVDEMLTSDVIVKLLNDSDDMIVEDVVDLIKNDRIKCPENIDLLNFPRLNNTELLPSLIKILSSSNSEDNFNKILDFASKGNDEFIREEAIEALIKTKFSITSKVMRDLYNNETVLSVKKKIIELIINKGDNSLSDVLFEAFSGSIDKRSINNDALEKIILFGNQEYLNKSFELCKDKNKIDLLVKYLLQIINTNCTIIAEYLVHWCFDNEIKIEDALLVSGKLNTIPITKIQSFINNENIDIKINSLRALENRVKNKEYISQLNEIYTNLKPKIINKNFSIQWSLLTVIDSIFEFDSKEKAIIYLEDFYNTIIKEMEHSFPLRAAWERLKIFGVNIHHDRYSEAGPTTPYPWSDRQGPFFKKVITNK